VKKSNDSTTTNKLGNRENACSQVNEYQKHATQNAFDRRCSLCDIIGSASLFLQLNICILERADKHFDWISAMSCFSVSTL